MLHTCSESATVVYIHNWYIAATFNHTMRSTIISWCYSFSTRQNTEPTREHKGRRNQLCRYEFFTISRRWMHPNTVVTMPKLTNLCKPCKTMTSIQIPKKLLFEHIAQELGLYVSTIDVKNMSPNTFTASTTVTPTHHTTAPHNKKSNLLPWFYTNYRSSNWIHLQRCHS
jgi:hypothetical protein